MNLSPELILCKVYGEILNSEILRLLIYKNLNSIYANLYKHKNNYIITNIETDNISVDEKEIINNIITRINCSNQLSSTPVLNVEIENNKIVFHGRITLLGEENLTLGSSIDARNFNVNYITDLEFELLQRLNPNIINEGLKCKFNLSDVKSLTKRYTANEAVIFDDYNMNSIINNIIKLLDPIIKSINNSEKVNSQLFINCINTSKTSLKENVNYPIISLREDLSGLVGIEVDGIVKHYKTERFKLVE